MNFESAPVTPTETVDTTYEDAVRKQSIEAHVNAYGENFDQDRVDTLMDIGKVAYESTEVTQAGNDLLNDLTQPESEEGSDVLATEAARRLIDQKALEEKLALQDLAVKNNWDENQYQAELQKR